MNTTSHRFSLILLIIATGLLIVSVILQGIMCVAILSLHKPVDVLITNKKVPVNVANTSDIDVNVKNHYIIDGDPIPVRIVR